MRLFALLLSTVVLALTGGPPVLAQPPDIRLESRAYPATIVAAGGEVTVEVGIYTSQTETLTITSLMSAGRGDLADPRNDALVDTTCSTPSTYTPGDSFGAADWGCTYRVWIEGETGDVSDVITARITLSDGSEIERTSDVTVTLSEDLGTIRGTIIDDVSGAPVVGVMVLAEGPSSGMAATDSAGRFSIEGLIPGSYTLLSGNLAVEYHEYAREFWDGAATAADADLVNVVAGAVATIEWQLSLGGVIEGRITDESTGGPLADVGVSWIGLLADGQREGPYGGIRSDSEGRYRVTGLHDVDVLVCFGVDGYERECWDDRTDFGSGLAGIPGDPIAAAPKTSIVGIDAELTPVVSPPTPPPTTPSEPTPVPPTALPATGVGTTRHAVIASALVALLTGLVALMASRRSSRTLVG